ncbi:MAG: hypothetical protein R3C49_08100 [Planctomycetaceae bacterium]
MLQCDRPVMSATDGAVPLTPVGLKDFPQLPGIGDTPNDESSVSLAGLDFGADLQDFTDLLAAFGAAPQLVNPALIPPTGSGSTGQAFNPTIVSTAVPLDITDVLTARRQSLPPVTGPVTNAPLTSVVNTTQVDDLPRLPLVLQSADPQQSQQQGAQLMDYESGSIAPPEVQANTNPSTELPASVNLPELPSETNLAPQPADGI